MVFGASSYGGVEYSGVKLAAQLLGAAKKYYTGGLASAKRLLRGLGF
jgi:hypothetical protein